jgi:hypothetical protein
MKPDHDLIITGNRTRKQPDIVEGIKFRKNMPLMTVFNAVYPFFSE